MSELAPRKPWTAAQWMALGATCFGAYLAFFAVVSAFEIVRTRNWPTTEGVVTRLEVHEGGTSAEFVVAYQYESDGQSYQGRWGEGSNHGRGVPGADSENESLKSLIDEFRGQYGEGKSITVHFNPAEPSDSFIQPEENPLIALAIIGIFGMLLGAALPFSMRSKAKRGAEGESNSEEQRHESTASPRARKAARAASTKKANRDKPSDSSDSSAEVAAFHQLIGSTDWSPGRRVTFRRPPISKQFLLVSGVIGGVLGVLALYMIARNATEPWEPLSAWWAGVFFATIGFLVPVITLQGLWPRRQTAFDWDTGKVRMTSSDKTTIRDIKSVQRLSLRSATGLHELDLEFDNLSVGLLSSIDHGFSQSVNLPFEQLPQLADRLAEALNVPVTTPDSPRQMTRGFWGNVPLLSKFAIGCVVATILGHLSDVLDQRVAIGVLATVMLGVAGHIQFTTSFKAKTASAGSRWPAFIALLVVGVGLAVACSLVFDVTMVGSVLVAIVLTTFVLICFCTPDLVMSQRRRIQAPMLQILNMRLLGLPVQQLVQAAAILRDEGRRCPLAAAERVYLNNATSNASELAEAIRRAADDKQVTPLRFDPSNALDSPNVGLRHHLTMLVGAAVGIGVIGFFFVVTSGVQHADNLLIDRNWVETEGVITESIPPAGRDHSARYRFTYRIGEKEYSSISFGPRNFEPTPVKVQYDRNQPEVARLVGGWRADGLPLIAIFFAALSALCVLPIPIVLGHIFASMVAGGR